MRVAKGSHLKEAKKHSTSYQKMIRRVIDVYTEKYKKTA